MRRRYSPPPPPAVEASSGGTLLPETVLSHLAAAVYSSQNLLRSTLSWERSPIFLYDFVGNDNIWACQRVDSPVITERIIIAATTHTDTIHKPPTPTHTHRYMAHSTDTDGAHTNNCDSLSLLFD